jgi:hypothetical protein
MTFLPEKDCLYLENRNLNFEEIVEGDRVGIILRQFNLPIGSFDVASADVLIFLPKDILISPLICFILSLG